MRSVHHSDGGGSDRGAEGRSGIVAFSDALKSRGLYKRPGKGFCPVCESPQSSSPSLSFKEKNGTLLVHCFGKGDCTFADIIGVLELSASKPNGSDHAWTEWELAAEYEYTDIHAELISTKTRKERRNGSGKSQKAFSWSSGNPDVLYRVVELRESDGPVILNEGEKATDRCWEAGIAATCTPTTKYEPGPMWEPLRDRDVVIVADRDKEGSVQARKQARCLEGVARTVRIVQSALDIPKADAFDHMEAGLGIDDFVSDSAHVAEGLKPLSEYPERAVRYLVPGRVLLGMMTVLDGQPGTLKTQLAILVGAAVTKGRSILGSDGISGGVIFASLEDPVPEVIRPRFRVADADLTRVFPMDRPLVLPDDVPYLKSMIEQHNVRLLVIDPLLGQFSRDVDTHKDADLRSALAELNKLAEETGVAILGIRHHSKDEKNKNPLSRGLGGTAITANARCLLVAGVHDGKHVLAVGKCNLAEKAKSIAYEPEPVMTEIQGEPAEICRVRLLGTVDVSARDLMRDPEDPKALDEAIGSLVELLRENGGRMLANDALAGLKAEHSDRTVRRAKAKCGVGSERIGKEWFWTLPGDEFSVE